MIAEFKGEYNWLSNFYHSIIHREGMIYYSVEHAYQAAKNNSPKWKEFCTGTTIKPGEVKRAGAKVELRGDWEEVKMGIMKDCLRIKFTNSSFTEKLLATGDEHIQEGNYWNDDYWGVCLKKGTGENHLGRLIMEIRTELLTSKREEK